MSGYREQEQESLRQCRNLLHSSAGQVFARWLRLRMERRMYEAANSSQEAFEKTKGKYQELQAQLQELEREIQ